MREIRTSGSEGGGAELNRLSLPLSCAADLPAGRGLFQNWLKMLDLSVRCVDTGRGVC